MPSASGPDVLQTARLLLRPRSAADAALYRRLWTERDPRVPAHRRIDAHGRPTTAEVAQQIRDESERPGHRLLGVRLRSTGELIGYCGLIPPESADSGEPTLAYELAQSAHGHGYATEAAGAVVAWSEELGHRRLWADVWDWNIASRRVLDKLGFNETGRVVGESEHGKSLLHVREASRRSHSPDDTPMSGSARSR